MAVIICLQHRVFTITLLRVIQFELSYHELIEYLFNTTSWPINTFKMAAMFQDGRNCLSINIFF